MNKDYSVKDIKLVSDIEHIRLRPGMYIGEVDHPYQLLNEALDNALDEVLNDFSNSIDIWVDTNTCKYTIRDYGRGIPIGLLTLPDSDYQLEALEVLMTKSFSGGKFNNSNYNFKSGLHGLGNKCINALSDYCRIVTHRGSQKVEFISNNGTKTSLTKDNNADPDGVLIEFIADGDIFSDIEIPLELIYQRVDTLKAFGLPINLYIDDILYESDKSSLVDLVDTDNSIYYQIGFEEELDDRKMTVILQYTSSTYDRYLGYTNLLYNKSGGTHTRLIKKSIMKVWSWLYPKDTILKKDDCLLGLNCLVAAFIPNTSFSSQTKDRLTVDNSELEELMTEFENSLYKYLKKNEELTQALLSRFEQYRISQNKLLDQKSITSLVTVDKSVAKTKRVSRKSIVPGLLECTNPEVEGSELYITEGNSASGGAARTRDIRTQSILPLRGKILNTSTMTAADSIATSDVILNLVNAVGCSIGEDLDTSTCRYEKIIIVADADPDGRHISALVASLFINHMKDLVLEGKVYVLYPPLFGYRINGEYYFTNDFDDIPKDIVSKKSFTRYKGLGEMDDDEFYQACLIPNSRNLYRLDYPTDIVKFNKIMGTSSGKRELLKDLGLLIEL